MISPETLPEETEFIEDCIQSTVAGYRRLQSLWSGYGEILEVRFATLRDSMVLKTVHPPQTSNHPRGWNSDVGHQRKLRSYDVELEFYARYAERCPSSARVARCHGYDRRSNRWLLLLENLNAAGYDKRREVLSKSEISACLRWLASFHATFLNKSVTGLWPLGTYWHLSTRNEEFAALTDDALRHAGPLVDRALRECPFQTTLHGDAKAANFCFSDRAVAAVDFQYVGGGPGIKDVAYFFSSCLDDSECERSADQHLDTYFAELRRKIGPSVDGDELESHWRSLYPAAWADFHRFLAGWAPGHWKIHRYTRAMTERAIENLGSE